jgi:hypothetical protein
LAIDDSEDHLNLALRKRLRPDTKAEQQKASSVSSYSQLRASIDTDI